MMNSDSMKLELEQAISAGERALSSLRAAQSRLESAGNWGMLDMLGGGMFTSMIKRSKMGDASGYIEEAKRDLRTFERELRDVSLCLDANLDTDGFLAFADMFMDNFFADYLVQRQISQARKQVGDVIRRVESIVMALRRKHRELC